MIKFKQFTHNVVKFWRGKKVQKLVLYEYLFTHISGVFSLEWWDFKKNLYLLQSNYRYLLKLMWQFWDSFTAF